MILARVLQPARAATTSKRVKNAQMSRIGERKSDHSFRYLNSRELTLKFSIFEDSYIIPVFKLPCFEVIQIWQASR